MKEEVEWGAVFDWDGVIVDSSGYHEQSWELMAERDGLSLPDGHFKKGFGMKNERIIPEILKWSDDPGEIQRLADRKETIYREILREKGIEPVPGVVEWLDVLKENGVPCVIASSTSRANIDCALDLLGIADRFDAITSGDEVANGKPAPDIFLLAARKIGILPARCVVFEDAHVGIEAGLAAGMKVIAVTTTHPPETLKGATLVVDRLDELTLKMIDDISVI